MTHDQGSRKVTIPAVAETTTATITVRGEDRRGVLGPRATARVKAAKAKKTKGQVRRSARSGPVWAA